MGSDRTKSSRVRDQTGETLLETLVAILILAMVAVASYTALSVAVRSSAQQRDAGVAETLLRNAAEQLQDPGSLTGEPPAIPYVPRADCPDGATYGGLPGWPDGSTEVAVVAGLWKSTNAQSEELVPEFRDPGDCPLQGDPGLQLLRLSITTPSGLTHSLDVLKRGPYAN